MEVLDIARWQFGIVTVYHFLFVPITIGLTLLLAILESTWVRTEQPERTLDRRTAGPLSGWRWNRGESIRHPYHRTASANRFLRGCPVSGGEPNPRGIEY